MVDGESTKIRHEAISKPHKTNNMIIHIRTEASRKQDNDSVSVEELGITEDEWNSLNPEERNGVLMEWIGEKERPYWMLVDHQEIEE